MAHKKAGGSTALGRDSHGQRLGVKVADGEMAKKGDILVRQRGTSIHPGENVKKGSDDTLFAAEAGTVKFASRKRTRFDGSRVMATFAHVLPKK